MGSTSKAFFDDRLEALFDSVRKWMPDYSIVDFLGFDYGASDIDTAYLTFDMHERLAGNPIFRTLHGGLISAAMDIVGGQVAFLQLFKMFKEETMQKQLEHFSKVATIDLRVDYLQPGKGERFTAKGWPLKAGNKVVTVRMELQNEKSDVIAVGIGTYSIA